MGTGRAANATGARASAHRTRLQLALVGRADERAARHHLRRILPLIEISAKRNDWAQKGSRSYSPPPSHPGARPRASRVASPASSDPACSACTCGAVAGRAARPERRPATRPPRTRVGGATWRIVRDLVGVRGFMRTHMSYCSPRSADVLETSLPQQHSSERATSVRRGRPRLLAA